MRDEVIIAMPGSAGPGPAVFKVSDLQGNIVPRLAAFARLVRVSDLESDLPNVSPRLPQFELLL